MDTNDSWTVPDGHEGQLIAETIALRLAYVYQLLAELLTDERLLRWLLTRPRFDDVCVGMEVFDYATESSMRVHVYHPAGAAGE